MPLFDTMMVRVLLLGPELKVGTRLHPVCTDAFAAHRVSAPVVRMWQRDQSVARSVRMTRTWRLFRGDVVVSEIALTPLI